MTHRIVVRPGALKRVRTNELALATPGGQGGALAISPWDMRSFRVSGAGALELAPLDQTPRGDPAGLRVNDQPLDAAAIGFINANGSAVTTATHCMPDLLCGWHATSFPRIGDQAPNLGTYWVADPSGPVLASAATRFPFSVGTCNGCHSGETKTRAAHVRADISPFQEAGLSGFLEQSSWALGGPGRRDAPGGDRDGGTAEGAGRAGRLDLRPDRPARSSVSDASGHQRDRHRHLVHVPGAAIPVLGREEELTWLDRCLDLAFEGQPQVALLAGEPGIGKTSLMREVRVRAAERGFRVAAGSGDADGGAPYGRFADALGARFEALVAPAADRGAAAEPPSPDTTDVPPPTRSACHTLLEQAARDPLALVLDDLHWADEGSLRLLSHLVFSAADASLERRVPMLLVGAMRNLDVAAACARTVARLEREPICARLELGGLAEEDVRQLLRHLGLDLGRRAA